MDKKKLCGVLGSLLMSSDLWEPHTIQSPFDVVLAFDFQ